MDEITCDFAEIYHVLDADALPPRLFATLALGLPDESRFKRALSGSRAGGRDLLLAAAVDRLSTLVWFQTKDGQKGRNRPKSIVESMTRKEEEKEQVFSVPIEEFGETLSRIRGDRQAGEEHG